MLTIYPKSLKKLPEIDPRIGFEGGYEITEYNENINVETRFAGIKGIEYWLDELTHKRYLDTLKYGYLGYTWLGNQSNDEVLSYSSGN